MPKPKGKSLGPLFAETLAALEYCESTAQANMRGRDVELYINELGDFTRGAWYMLHDDADNPTPASAEFLDTLISRWANDANDLREAFKFRGAMPDLNALATEAVDPHVLLPFPRTCLIADNVGTLNDETAKRIAEKQAGENETVVCIETMVIYAEVRILPPDDSDDDWYREVGIGPGDEFISLTFSFRDAHKGVHGLVPAEVHLTQGDSLLVGPRWCAATPSNYPDDLMPATHRLCEMAAEVFCKFLCALDAKRAKQMVLPGIKLMRKPKARKKRKYEFYEHTLLVIDPHKTLPATDGFGSGRKHRLHPVRGFWRRTRSGKRVWIKPHWRGDKDLGVVTHDYEVIDNVST